MTVVAVNIEPSVRIEAFADWWRSFGAPDVVFAADVGRQATTAFGVRFLGTKVFVDRTGRIRRTSAGIAGYDTLRRFVETLL